MTKHILIFSVIVISFTVKAETSKSISDPPFYMPTFEEYKSLREGNAKTYQEKLGQILDGQKLSMPQIANGQFGRMVKKSSDWYQFMQRIHVACTSNQKLNRTCQSLARLRVETLLNNPGDLIPGGTTSPSPHNSQENTPGDSAADSSRLQPKTTK